MDSKTTSTTKLTRRGFTLVEFLISSGIGSIFFLTLGYLSFFSARSYVAMINYADLETRSRNTLDTMSAEIRQANKLNSFTSSSLNFEDSDGQALQYVYDSSAGTLSRIKNNETKTMLTGCDTLTFGVFQRNPTNDYNVVATTNASLCKLIQLNWKCSRTILAAKVNTESVQSAKIVIRKQ
jgi:prepilin-type N-terminal cleavage/methylation domain-containing protein